MRKSFNNTKIFPTESALRYIARFRDAYHLAKSVGLHLNSGKLIDKFLLSMQNCNNKYSSTKLNYKTQRRNETFTANYTLEPLSLSEIEAALLSIDENSDTTRFNANFVRNFKKDNTKSDIICYHCKQPGHIRPNCPILKKKREQNRQTSQKSILPKSSANSAKHVVLQSATNISKDSVQINMAKHGNAGRKFKSTHISSHVPLSNDLLNWVMDSGCTCHMTPFKSDFEPNSLFHDVKTVEVADGTSVPANLSGTIKLTVFTEIHDTVYLTLTDVLYVPQLSRRLFSLMSLIEQGHDFSLSRTKGIQIYFCDIASPVSMPMPNYHLFASYAAADMNSKPHGNKQKIDLDLLY